MNINVLPPRRGVTFATGLALAALAAWALSTRAQDPSPAGIAPATAPARVTLAAPSTLPVTFDGHVSKFEYSDAAHITFPNGHGIVDAYIKCHDGFLYFAFLLPDLTPHPGDDIVTMLDTRNGRDASPAPGNIRAYVRRKIENSRAHQGKDGKWADHYGDWDWRAALHPVGWEVETRIPLKSLGVDFTRPVTMGLAFRIWDDEPRKIWNYPVGSDEAKPNTWATLTLGTQRQ